ncbi:methanogen output domain 1-containing protein [Aurantiacibacter sp. MUD61]|uniref:methanogen output domain 1-containing protein n=1 Tax=Aurantiacibacter sp. MUD61 TaxID=3009083 RepID=UPI0022F116FB|nr:methanogen output domain 1-containing protein [Aurantiacibacter sp. MUD61]
MRMNNLELPLERDRFFRTIIRSLSGTLEQTIGLEEASGYIALVGSEVGEWIREEYNKAADKTQFTPREVADILVDLKRRIGGKFSVERVENDRIILRNTACPFGELVKNRPSLCQMTTNVFGRIAADNQGYARIALPKTIAKGDDHCLAIVYLTRDNAAEERGREFFSTVPEGV